VPKRVPPLSAKALAAVRPQQRPTELVDGFVPGLRVRVHPNGTRSWSLNVRDSKGMRRRFDVGANLSLADARRKAEDLRKAIRDGADPTAERRAARLRARAAHQGVGTLEALLDTYFSSGPGAQQRRAQKTKQLIKTVFAKALRSSVLDLDRAVIQLLADAWRRPQTAALAVRSLRPCLKWAEKRALVKVGSWDLEPPAKPGRRDRFLTTDELAAIWPCLTNRHGQVMKWLLRTGCRLNEAVGMAWGEINGDQWTIPASRAKNKRSRVVPLPRQALEMLKKPENSKADTLVFPSTRGGVLSNWDRETKDFHQLSGTAGWHRHDLRHTVATMLGELGFAPHVIGIVLGHAHVAKGATAFYAHSRYQREHREALQALADKVDAVVVGEDNVIRLRA
jgi:integrase